MTEPTEIKSGVIVPFPTRHGGTGTERPDTEHTEHTEPRLDDTVEGVVLVDPPAGGEDDGDLRARLLARRAERRPIIAPWLRSRDDLLAVLRLAGEHAAYVAGFHAARLPLYVARVLGRAPIGACRITAHIARWVLYTETSELRRNALAAGNTLEYTALVERRGAVVKRRLATVAVIGGAAAGGWALIAVLAPWWVIAAAAASTLAVLAHIGRPADAPPLVERAVIPARVERLTSDVIVRALGSLGIPALTKAADKNRIEFVAPITRDGPGWRAEINLPYGVTVEQILDKRRELASGLRRPLGSVWPEPVSAEHPGRLVLWVGDQEMRKAAQPAWPLAKSGVVSLFDPIPYGTDQRGRRVDMTLMFNNVLIGSMPRYGKTFALRVLALSSALDPYAELRVFELKGTGDLSALKPIAHHYAQGATDDALEKAVASLRDLVEEMNRRAGALDGLPRHLAPEFKVTPELAKRRDLGLHPIVVAIDECQELFTHEEYGEEAAKYATQIIKRGPALGIILILATQRPDAKSLPTGVSANAGIRVCLRVMGQLENDMILGTSMYRNGVRATDFTVNDKGISWVVGATDDPTIVRSYYIDGPTAEAVARRAYRARVEAGTLSGEAIGETMSTGPVRDLLADILTVMSEEKEWNSVLAARLAEHWPDAYGQWAELDDRDRTAALTAALAPYGVPVIQVWGATPEGRGANRRGIARADVVAAHRRRRGDG